MSDQRKLVEALGLEDTDTALLALAEVVGYLLLMTHWMRGMFAWLGSIPQLDLSDAERENWLRMAAEIEAYEEFAWQVAPPRAMLSQLRAFRKAGYLDEAFAKLLDHDAQGRMGYGQAEIPEELSVKIKLLNQIAREA